MKKKSIELYKGVIVCHKGKVTNLDYICELWDLFGWDIKNNKDADECAKAITRQLFIYGYIDLKDNDGCPIHIEIAPSEV